MSKIIQTNINNKKSKQKQTHKNWGTNAGYGELKGNHTFSYLSKSVLQNFKKLNYRIPIIFTCFYNTGFELILPSTEMYQLAKLYNLNQ